MMKFTRTIEFKIEQIPISALSACVEDWSEQGFKVVSIQRDNISDSKCTCIISQIRYYDESTIEFDTLNERKI